MAKIVFQMLMVLLTAWAILSLFSSVEARKLHQFKGKERDTKSSSRRLQQRSRSRITIDVGDDSGDFFRYSAAVHKRETAPGFVAPTFQLSKLKDWCYDLYGACLTGARCADPKCHCSINVNPNFPPYCIVKDCEGRECYNDESCWSSEESQCNCGRDKLCHRGAPPSDDLGEESMTEGETRENEAETTDDQGELTDS